MRIPIAKIGLFLVLILVLPPFFFSAYEVSNMYRNEQMIDSIYKSQLGTIIFSINQYSDDIVNNWATDLEQIETDGAKDKEAAYADFLRLHSSVILFFISDAAGESRIYSKEALPDSIGDVEERVARMMQDNQDKLSRLKQYMKSGYRKIEPIDLTSPNMSLLLFALNTQTGVGAGGILINTTDFVAENLGPKIQSVAQSKFFISVFDPGDNEIYANDSKADEEKNIEHKQALWLIPDYHLGIQLRGETIEDLVKQRTYFNIVLIIILDVVLLLAAWFVYRSIRQEVKLAQLKSEFVSNVSHEIRTPLAIINMYSETLEMDRIKDEKKKKEYYKIINTETNRLSGIVNKILSFSKIESGKRDYKLEETDLNGVVEQIIHTYQHHFKNKGFTCDFHPSEDIPNISVDKEAVTDAVINLIDNAIKYSDNKKQIDILTGVDKNTVFVEVKDYGLGIDQKHRKLIFDKFYRVTEGDLALKAKGSGIGLSIVKHIMEAHDGTITLQSTPGEGSSFTLNFPRKTT